MLPPQTAALLESAGHDATTPAGLGAHNLSDEVLVQLAAAERRVIVTENAVDFAAVTTCAVLLVRKAWWPANTLSTRLATAVGGWTTQNPAPGAWAHWLPRGMR
jgi:hypothetical protein